tara:strand:- start:5672 stop:5893 length:222 start_codon:yes stop_codon:yes gene_type:complete
VAFISFARRSSDAISVFRPYSAVLEPIKEIRKSLFFQALSIPWIYFRKSDKKTWINRDLFRRISEDTSIGFDL